MFYVFLVGLAKLHCGATPPSVMVLLKFLLNSNFLTSMQNKYFKITFPQKILSIFTAAAFGTFLKCVSRDRITFTFVNKI